MKQIKFLVMLVLFTSILMSCNESSTPTDPIDKAAKFQLKSIEAYNANNSRVGTGSMNYLGEKLSELSFTLYGKTLTKEYSYNEDNDLSEIIKTYNDNTTKMTYVYINSLLDRVLETDDNNYYNKEAYIYNNDDVLIEVNEYDDAAASNPIFKCEIETDASDNISVVTSGWNVVDYKVSYQDEYTYNPGKVVMIERYYYSESDDDFLLNNTVTLEYTATDKLSKVYYDNVLAISINYDANDLMTQADITMGGETLNFNFTWEEVNSNIYQVIKQEHNYKHYSTNFISDEFNILSTITQMAL